MLLNRVQTFSKSKRSCLRFPSFFSSSSNFKLTIVFLFLLMLFFSTTNSAGSTFPCAVASASDSFAFESFSSFLLVWSRVLLNSDNHS